MRSLRLLLVLLLAGLSLPLIAQEPDRSKPPQLGPEPALVIPPIQHFTLSNGTPVFFVAKHQVPLVQINVLIKAGSVLDPAGKSGLATMTADMLEEGAGKRNALELADAIDFLGADISTSATYHATGIMLHTPLSKLDSALALLSDIVLRPTFPQEELDRLRNERLTTLLQWRDEPRAIASVMFDRALYGPSTPYGTPTLGNESSLKLFTVKDLKEFHAAYYHARNASIVVVGDITPEVIAEKLEGAFGAWKGDAVPAPPEPTMRQMQLTMVYLVDKPDAPQSEIRIGRIGAARSTKDFYALQVMNTILGGSFTSRLNQNLREEHGYTYGAGSGFAFRTWPGPFVARSAVQTAVTDKALAEFMKELTNIRTPVPNAELSRAENYITLGYPENFETVRQVSYQLNEMAQYDLPEDYFNTYTDHIREITQKDVQRVAEKYVDPSAMAVVVVGDRKTIEAGIEALRLGPLTVLSIRDVLGPAPMIGGK